jgi:hypothetical protein
VIATDSAGGFLDAVALPPEAWEPLTTDAETGMMMLPLIMLGGEADLYMGPVNSDGHDESLAPVPDVVATCVLAIHEFWRQRRDSPAKEQIGGHDDRDRLPLGAFGWDYAVLGESCCHCPCLDGSNSCHRTPTSKLMPKSGRRSFSRASQPIMQQGIHAPVHIRATGPDIPVVPGVRTVAPAVRRLFATPRMLHQG